MPIFRDEICGHPVRGVPGTVCLLKPGHKGYHSCVVFTCDGCGRRLRGQPTAKVPETGWDDDGWLAFCFLCINEEQRARDEYDHRHPERTYAHN